MAGDFASDVASLYSKQRDCMLREARKRLPSWESADDFVQQAFECLTKRGTLAGIDNAEAFVMSVLQNQIAGHLRQVGQTQIEFTEALDDTHFPAALDVQAELEQKETEAILRSCVGKLKNAKARRRIGLASLGHKPSKIALMEGGSVTSREVSWSLYDTLGTLKGDLKKQGIVSRALPFGLVHRFRVRFSAWGPRLAESFLRLDPASLSAQIVVAALLVGAGPWSPIAGSIAEAHEPEQTAVSEPALNALRDTPAVLQSSIGEPFQAERVIVPAASGAPARIESQPASSAKGFQAALPENAVQTALPASNEDTGIPVGEPVGPPAPPSKTELDTPAGHDSLTHWSQGGGNPAPPLTDQLAGLAKDPRSLAEVECKGFATCEDGKLG